VPNIELDRPRPKNEVIPGKLDFKFFGTLGKTMNSYLQNHDFMGMLPSPHEAEKQGLAPPDIFPHKSRIKKSWSETMGYYYLSRP
jgi:hypothetical protein